ncbi:hypothetical protein DFR68_12425 [Nocardia mexicana]|uniref:Uncharacterized protein n=1 Tax=Nocardia mexicana TaxID=279262 RepID=A0A370GG48_9NOCA|nr:hypothetical protein DFR68_12425 [Nocardia mexicana]
MVAPAAASIALACTGALTDPFTWQATTLVAIPVIAVLAAAIVRPPSRTPPDPALRRGTVVWGTLLAAALAWEAYAFVRQPDWLRASAAHPTLSTLLDPAFEQGPVRFAGWLVWVAAGCWLVWR